MEHVFLCLIYLTGLRKYLDPPQVSKCILKMGIMLVSWNYACLLEAFAHHTLNLYSRKQIPLDYLSVY